jgi:hypothetical protein
MNCLSLLLVTVYGNSPNCQGEFEGRKKKIRMEKLELRIKIQGPRQKTKVANPEDFRLVRRRSPQVATGAGGGILPARAKKHRGRRFPFAGDWCIIRAVYLD